jgi:hypothetical protein
MRSFRDFPGLESETGGTRHPARRSRMLIRAYGMFWNPEIVDWEQQGPGNRGTF